MMLNYLKAHETQLFYKTHRYRVRENGNVYDNGSLMSPDNDFYTFDLGGVVITLHRAIVMLNAFKPLFEIEDTFLLEMGYLHANGDRDDFSITNLYWIIPDNGIECFEVPGNKIIPVASRFSIDSTGTKIWDRLNKVFYTPNKSNEGYLNISVAGYNGERYKLGVHRAQLLANYPLTSMTLKMVGNHLNGIKDDNRLENLEYVTYSQNAKHAVDTALVNRKRVIEVLDLSDNKISTFDTLTDLANFLGVNSGAIYTFITTQPLMPYNDKYAFKYADTPYEWPEYKQEKLDEWKRNRDNAANEKACYCRNIETGQIIIADSPYSLAKIINFTPDQIKVAFRLQGGKENVGNPRIWPYLGYEFRWDKHLRLGKQHVYSKEEIDCFKAKTIITKPLKVTFNNGIVKVYASLYEMNLEIPYPSRPHVKQKLNENMGKYSFEEFLVEWLQY